MAIPASANRMIVRNAFKLLPDGSWEMKNKQIIICACGFVEGFRTFKDGEIAEIVEEHTKKCELRAGKTTKA